MNAVRQSCRPKHQVLTLKCYPRFQKGVQQVKPNSSELSYLLYYASTRRSKLPKLGAFLEKRTARDVWRGKIGNVQVTLQILAALIEKLPKDLPLYARSVLTILDAVLRSQDISMVEETIPTFEAFCQHQDMAVLAADQAYVTQYRDIVRAYAALASAEFATEPRTPLSKPFLLRWKNVGLQAIKSVVSSEALATDGVKQLNIVVPVILENLYSDGDFMLSPLQEQAETSEKQEREIARRRRMSIATVQTVDVAEGDPISASATTADADRVAEVEARVLALRCLEKLFVAGSNRGQILVATALILRFIVDKRPEWRDDGEKGGNWTTNLMEVIAKWTPVQDRFIILITSIETLSKSSATDKYEEQLTLATMVDWLLSSAVNLIGLSVMDILIGLLDHVLLLLQRGGRSFKPSHHRTPPTFAHSLPDVKETVDEASAQSGADGAQQTQSEPSGSSHLRQELIELLEKCIGDLATHNYYADQVSDMIRAVLSRLKPDPVHDVSGPESASGSPAKSHTTAGHDEITADNYFSFPAARVTALKAIKQILIVANLRKAMAGGGAESRNRVGIQVWQGTQWLLHDPEREVRHAYVDAFLSWLQLETNKEDLRVSFEHRKLARIGAKREVPGLSDKLARRIISTTSQKESVSVAASSSFLQHLHLVVYEIATESAVEESDILLLHLLLANLVENMGVNAVRHGLPVIMRLQDDFVSSNGSVPPAARLHIASLVHGYLWTLIEKFDLEATRVGGEIVNEITKRKRKGIWLDKVQLPPRTINYIVPMRPGSGMGEKTSAQVDKSAYTPFTALSELVDQIENAYNAHVSSPTASPAGSPGRMFSLPVIGQSYPGSVSTRPVEDQLPGNLKEQLLAPWSKEACLAELEAEKAKTSSYTGSRSGTGPSVNRHYRAVNGDMDGNASPTDTEISALNRIQDRPVSAALGLIGGLDGVPRVRRQSVPDGTHSPVTTSSRDSTLRVHELRRVLSVINSPNNVRRSSPLRGHVRPVSSPSSSESMVSHLSASDAGIIRDEATGVSSRPQSRYREGSETPKASAMNLANGEAANQDDRSDFLGRTISNDIPPVPPLPPSLAIPGGFPGDSNNVSPLPSPSYSPVPSDRPSTAPAQPRSRQSTKAQTNPVPTPRESRSLTRRKSRSGTRSTGSGTHRYLSPRPTSSRSGGGHGHSERGAYRTSSDMNGSPTGHRRDYSISNNHSYGRSMSLGRRVDVEKLLDGLVVSSEREHRADQFDGGNFPLPTHSRGPSFSGKGFGKFNVNDGMDEKSLGSAPKVLSAGRTGRGIRGGGIGPPPY
ncbi:hypothetical protein AJ80_09343 [Polytolypa hystricis UAMH7299]|uniref:Protein EFR3 n=1 Tax=Polytolypa hystricis (strain UAMH7299) TaxID=1447883 RepID=A0A2B7WSK9_POLH7|nr:hypothetical protein AJ80_09343 [Polytolypa hystricis UAMH7299]